MIDVGKPAPDFELRDQDGRPRRLADYRGQRVVLYFYPRADTPGCTIQAQGVRDRGADYVDAGAVVLGVSADTVAEIGAFCRKYSLDFTLLADPDHAVCERYGVWREYELPSGSLWAAERTTFLIDEHGIVREVFPAVSPETHDDVVLQALVSMGSAGTA